MEIKNAIIESARIEIEDHGILTAWVLLNYGDSAQGFGGYGLYLPKNFTHHKLNSVAGHFIYRVMEIADVEAWDELAGKTVRVKSDLSGVEAIGHIVKDTWFNPKEEFKEAGNES